MATRLSTIVGRANTAKKKYAAEAAAALNTLCAAEGLSGFIKEFKPVNDTVPAQPSTNKVVATRYWEQVKKVENLLADFLNNELAKDFGNAFVTCDVVVDGETIISKAHPTTLLTLNKELSELAGHLKKLKVASGDVAWSRDPNTGLLRSPSPTIQQSMAKTERGLVLYEATDKHPAQVKIIEEQVLRGNWETTDFCGALTIPQKEALVTRIEKLISAVSTALDECNARETTDSTLGVKVAGFLFGPIDSMPA